MSTLLEVLVEGLDEWPEEVDSIHQTPLGGIFGIKNKDNHTFFFHKSPYVTDFFEDYPKIVYRKEWEEAKMEKEKKFTKDMLIPGKHIVENKRGTCYFVLESSEGVFLSSDEAYYEIDCLEDDLTYNYRSHLTIVKVYEITYPVSSSALLHYLDHKKLVWEREEVLELTLKDLEEKYGCKVKIVEE